jgi:hypothetical protein
MPVIVRTAQLFELMCDRVNVFVRPWRYSMTDPFEDSRARLERLVTEVIKETDSAKCDELCDEIWRVLSERERLQRIHTASEREQFV